MTIIDIIAIAILAFGFFAGMHKGFIASALALAGYVGSWFLAKTYYIKLAGLALNNTNLMSKLSGYLEVSTSTNETAVAAAGDVIAQPDVLTNFLKTIAGKLDLSILKDAFVSNVNSDAFGDACTTAGQYLNNTVWTAVFQVLSFILIFIFGCLLVNLLVNLLNHTIRFPVLRGFDAVLGGVFGLARSIVFVLLLFGVAKLVINVFVPDYIETLQKGVIYDFMSKIDYVGIGKRIISLLIKA